MRIYVTSSWRKAHQQSVVDALWNAGHAVYWSEIDPNWQKWTTQQYVAALEHEYAKFGFNRDFEAMKVSDACVLVLPCGRSANAEAGWMKGAGKKVFVYIPPNVQIETELMYKMFDGIFFDIQDILAQLAKGGEA